MTQMIPPNSFDDEVAVVSAIMWKPEMFPGIRKIFMASNPFYNPKTSLIWQAMCDLWDKKIPIDLNTIKSALSKKLDTIGGEKTLVWIADNGGIPAAAPWHARRLNDFFQLRQLMLCCQDCLEEIREGKDKDEIFSRHKTQIRAVDAVLEEDQPDNLRAADLVYHDIMERYQKKKTLGIPTGLAGVDRNIQGLENSCTYYLGAYKHTGKSALALNIGINIDQQKKGDILYFNLESTALAQYHRRVANITGIPLTRIRTGNLRDPKEEEELLRAVGIISESRLLVMDSPRYRDLNQLTAFTESHALENNIALVVVDYCQRLEVRGKWSGLRDQFREIAHRLDDFGKNINRPLLILSQREEKTGYLKESRDIEDAADHVWYLTDEGAGHMKLVCTKGKDTGTWECYLDFDKHMMRFYG